MKLVDEFRDPKLGKKLLGRIRDLVEQTGRTADHPIKLMEVCGGHTHSIFKFGLEEMLPDALKLVHGPGCPVCVLPVGRVDDAVSLAENPGVIFCTYGDAMRVPGSKKSLAEAKAEGADIRTVYSPMDALELATAHPDRLVVFFGLGFETTAPSTALTVLEAQSRGADNFCVFSNHITIVPTLNALLETKDLSLDGFVGPGHVSMVIGIEAYQFVCDQYQKPFVVSGFEPLDVLQSVVMLLEQIVAGRAEVQNQYRRLVSDKGNPAAMMAIEQVFELREHFEWRGLGSIEQSGLRFKEAFAKFDAEKRLSVPALRVEDPKACQCGEVLQGRIEPWECKVFGTSCRPETPIGACMVSSEGACAAYYNYGRLSTLPVLKATAESGA